MRPISAFTVFGALDCSVGLSKFVRGQGKEGSTSKISMERTSASGSMVSLMDLMGRRSIVE